MDSQVNNNGDAKLKGLHQFSDDELLEALQNSSPEEVSKELPQTTDIPHFISAFKIEFGDNRVSSKILHRLYSEWSGKYITQTSFIIKMNDYTPSEMHGSRRYFLINSSAFVISGKTTELMFKEKREKTKSKHSRAHFEKYLKKFDLKPGNYWIDADNLFYLYDIWASTTNKRNPLGKHVFLQFCYLYLKYRSSNSCIWIQVDRSILKHISEEKIALLKRYRKEWNDKRKNKKKPSKVSQPPPGTESQDPV